MVKWGDFLPSELGLLGLAAGCVLLIVLERWHHLRAEGKRNEAELSRLNNLHLLTTALSGNNNPAQMAGVTLERTLQILGVCDGYVLLRARGTEELDCSRAKGLSSSTVERLSAGALRVYLASCADRWGNLMIFPDLRRSDVSAAWRRDPLFQDLLETLGSEGLRTLLVIGLTVRERSYGALVVGSRNLRAFDPSDLRLMLAVGNQISVALENYFLHRAAERHNEELKILHRVAEELGATFDLGQQLQILQRQLRGLLGARNFYLAFQDSGEGRLEAVVAFEDGPPESRAPADGLAEHVLRTRSPLRIARNFSEVAKRLGIACNAGIRAWAGVPIYFSGGAMGVLAVADFEREDALDERQFQLLQVLAGEAAAAIENARLFQREQRRARHLTLLNEIGRKATAVLSPSDLLSDICQQIGNAFGYDLVCVGTTGSDKGELVVEAQVGYGADLLGVRFKFGEGLPGIAAESGEPVLANVVERDRRYIRLHRGARSALSLPLRYRHETLGVLGIESFREHSFSEQDVLTLQTLADQLAIALHNARAYQVAREQAITDGLTGLKTHRYFMEALDAEWRRATRSGRSFSLIMMDLDGFKQVNDRYGHLEGDKVLMAVGQLLEARSRQSNVVARYGGDEFATLMPEATLPQAEIVAERVCQGVCGNAYLAGHGVTASSGLATFPQHGSTPEEILKVADSGVYLAKHEKGNCVRIASRFARPTDLHWNQHLLEAYLGVAVKRMF
jgi:diguanylate cyclase (GGDEF)-like protein